MLIRAIPFAALALASFVAGGATVWFTIKAGPDPSQPGQIVALGPSVHPHEIRDVPWFKKHPEDLKVKLNACNDDPGLAMVDPECVNADEAKSKIDFEAFINSAPK